MGRNCGSPFVYLFLSFTTPPPHTHTSLQRAAPKLLLGTWPIYPGDFIPIIQSPGVHHSKNQLTGLFHTPWEPMKPYHHFPLQQLTGKHLHAVIFSPYWKCVLIQEGHRRGHFFLSQVKLSLWQVLWHNMQEIILHFSTQNRVTQLNKANIKQDINWKC
jgi:hypothetical protein